MKQKTESRFRSGCPDRTPKNLSLDDVWVKNRKNFSRNNYIHRIHFGFTLIEILLSLGLIITILGMLWSMLGMFSRTYLITENRISRSQLVRSISQMLNDDLGAAVQDPIHPAAARESGSSFVRRFGLRGDAVSLQIDVVQPNLFVLTGEKTPGTDTKSNGSLMDTGFSGSLSNSFSEEGTGQGNKNVRIRHQVPELKTIYYEFIPPGRRVRTQKDSETISSDSNFQEGSKMVGSLQTPIQNGSGGISANPGDENIGGNIGLDSGAGGLGQLDPLTGNAMPLPGSEGGLVEKFGLSRRELDFETPSENAAGSGVFTDAEDPVNDSKFIGSLQAPPDQSGSELVSSVPGTTNFNPEGQNESQEKRSLPLTVSELAMSTEDGTLWAPEVVDCRFDYFDGTSWFSSWDSIERSGLPKAIRVSLVLMSLDDVQELRLSKEFWIWSEGREDKKINIDERNSGSQLVGSLQRSETGFGGNPGEQTGSFGLTGSLDLGIMPGGNETGAEESIKTLSFGELVRTLGLSPPMEREVITRVPTTPFSGHQVQQRRQPMQRSTGAVSKQGKHNAASAEETVGRINGSASRTVPERSAADRTFNGRTAEARTYADRTAGERSLGGRTAGQREFSDNEFEARSLKDRTTGERTVQNREFTDRTAGNGDLGSNEMKEVFVPDRIGETEITSPFKETVFPDPTGESSVSTKKPTASSGSAGQSWIRGKRK